MAVRRDRAGCDQLRGGGLPPGDTRAARGACVAGVQRRQRDPRARRSAAGRPQAPAPRRGVPTARLDRAGPATPARGVPRRGRPDAERGRVARTHEATFLPGHPRARRARRPARSDTVASTGLWSSMTEVDNQHVVVARRLRRRPRDPLERGDRRRRRRPAAGHRRRPARRGWRRRCSTGWPGSTPPLRWSSRPRVGVRRAERPRAAAATRSCSTSCAAPTLSSSTRRPRARRHAARRPARRGQAPLGVKLVSFPEAEPAAEGKRHSHVNWPADLSTFSADDQVAEGCTAPWHMPCARRRGRPASPGATAPGA